VTRQAIILAGGAGTRLRDRLGDLPKPMIPIAGRPLLEHQVDLCRRYGFHDLVFFVHYRADLIESHFGSGEKWGVQINYLTESQPLGTAGAVLAGWESLADRFLVLYGDTMVNVDLERLWQTHVAARADATLLLHPNDHPLDSDLVEMTSEGVITGFHARPHPPGVWRQNLVNAALYVLEKTALQGVRGLAMAVNSGAAGGAPAMLDFGKDVFPAMLREGRRLLGYNSPEYIKDIGKPERYDRVCREFANGTIARSSLAARQRAVFLDRDGTLIPDRDNLRDAEGLELLPGVAPAVHDLNHHAWRTVVVTNQPVIAKGWCDEAGMQRIHNKLETLLGREHAFLDRIFYCPHHPDAGFPGERPELKIPCACRKPGIGLIERAARELNIDLAQSWLIGDTTTDVQTARNAGLRSILVQTGAGGRDGKFPVKPDRVARDLAEAVEFVLASNPVVGTGADDRQEQVS
jgi:histidinol-phosphate phosphatase family protein